MTHRSISSSTNPTIKDIRKLKQKKYRDAGNMFFAEGVRIVSEAIETSQPICQIIYCGEQLTSRHGHEIIEQAERQNIDVIEVPEYIFKSLADKEGPQGIAAVIQQQWNDGNLVAKEKGLWIALESVQDPGNLGSIMRSGDAVGAMGIILLGECTDPFHPTCVRASMGAIFSQKLVKMSYEQLYTLKCMKSMKLIATVSHKATHYRDYNYPQDMILLMGSEQKGLPEHYIEICDVCVHIPMRGNVDSLNLSNAASVMLFTIRDRQERQTR